MTAPTAGLVQVKVFVRFSVVLVRFMRVRTRLPWVFDVSISVTTKSRTTTKTRAIFCVTTKTRAFFCVTTKSLGGHYRTRQD